jgi:hypothetical protein
VNIDFLAEVQSARPEERAWLALEYALGSFDKPVREAVWAAAIPHWFDANFLGALMNESEATVLPLLKNLVSLPFVEVFPGRGYNIHSASRELLLKRLWKNNRMRYREISRRAADFCLRQDQADTGWRAETIYHLLIARPEEGTIRLEEACEDCRVRTHRAVNEIDAMMRAYSEHAEAERLPRDQSGILLVEAMADFLLGGLSS